MPWMELVEDGEQFLFFISGDAFFKISHHVHQHVHMFVERRL